MTIDSDRAVDPVDMSRARNTSIADYARHLEALYRQWEDLKGLEGLELSAAISETEKRIQAAPASSTVDAAVQVMLISSLVEQLRVDNGDAKDVLLDRLEGLATSALGGLARQLDLDLSELGGTRYVPGLVDPLARCDDNLRH